MEMLLSYFYLLFQQVYCWSLIFICIFDKYSTSELQHSHSIPKFKHIISKNMFSPWLIFTFVSSQKNPVVCQDSLVSKAQLQTSQNTFG